MRKLVWMSRDGKTQGEAGKEEYYENFRLSPDGTRLAVTISDGNGNADIWALDFARPIMSRLTFTPKPRYNPAWSPDGRQIAYDSRQTGIRQLYRKEASGADQEEQLTSGPDHKGLSDWSPDGHYLLYQDLNPKTGFDLGVLTLGGGREPLVLKTPFSKALAKFSPDGNWIAYMSYESGRNEVYLRSFPVSGGQWQVSSKGGSLPRWRADGKELYYLEPASKSMMATGIRMVGGNIQTDAPRKLFTIPTAPGGGFYDVTADGQRFIMFEAVKAEEGPPKVSEVVLGVDFRARSGPAVMGFLHRTRFGKLLGSPKLTQEAGCAQRGGGGNPFAPSTEVRLGDARTGLLPAAHLAVVGDAVRKFRNPAADVASLPGREQRPDQEQTTRY